MGSTRQTLEQIRAQSAWRAVEEALKKKSEPDALANTCKKTASRILTSGVLQAMAFAKEKGGHEHETIVKTVSEHLRTLGLLGSKEDVVKALIETNSAQMRRATDEVLALMMWMGRFAGAKKGEGG